MTTRGLLEEIYKLEESRDIKAKEYAFEVRDLNQLANQQRSVLSGLEFISAEDRSREQKVLESQLQTIAELEANLARKEAQLSGLEKAVKTAEQDEERAINFMKLQSPLLQDSARVSSSMRSSPSALSSHRKKSSISPKKNEIQQIRQ